MRTGKFPVSALFLYKVSLYSFKVEFCLMHFFFDCETTAGYVSPPCEQTNYGRKKSRCMCELCKMCVQYLCTMQMIEFTLHAL